MESSYRDLNSVVWNLFWFGLVLYTISYAFPGIFFSIKFTQAFQVVGIFFFLTSGMALARWNFESTYFKIVFIIFILWSILTVIRGFSFEYNFLKHILFNGQFSVFLYFVPFIVLFTNKLEYISKLFNAIIALSFFFLFYVLLYRDIIFSGVSNFHRIPTGVTEVFVHFLSLPTAFILMTYVYHRKRRIFFSIFIITLTFLIVTIRARRGLMFMTVCFMLFSYLMYFFTNKNSILKIIISIFLMGFIVSYAFFTYSRNQYGTFGLITSRIDEDTRKGVEDYFFASMSTTDLIIGRGINGMYYCPGIDETAGSVTVMRTVIETGYLQFVLKGGYIYLVMYLVITIPALYLGLFWSKNILSKACALWLLLYTVFLYPTYVNMFSLTYIIIWISVSICYSKSIRDKSEDEIKLLLLK